MGFAPALRRRHDGHAHFVHGVAAYGAVDGAGFREHARSEGEALCEGSRKLQPGVFAERHDDEPACVLVYAVHDAGPQAPHAEQGRIAGGEALHERACRAGRAGVHGEAGRLVADDDVAVFVEHVQFPVLCLQRAFRGRQGDFHALAGTYLAGRLRDGAAVNAAQAVFYGFFQRFAGNVFPAGCAEGVPDGAVEAQAPGAAGDGKGEAGAVGRARRSVMGFRHQLCALPRTVMVWNDCPMVVPLCRLGTSLPGVRLVMTARPMTRR